MRPCCCRCGRVARLSAWAGGRWCWPCRPRKPADAVCRHCGTGRRGAPAARGLCGRCYANTAVRQGYPAVSAAAAGRLGGLASARRRARERGEGPS